MPPEQPYLSQCPSCKAAIDVTALEPFAKINCPECKQSVRVRRKFDHFVILKQIGEGGMSRVFEAEDETLGRHVALKILNRTYSKDAARMAQFQQEALITARVTHPNVIKLYSVGYDQGHFFIAMELVTGGSLEARIKRDGMVPEKDALRIGRQVGEGLRAAHRMGLLHRDVKPANILFAEDGTAKVVDFGLALFVDRKDESAEIWATPFYVSPEKVIENAEDFRSDLFSLGATLYHALTGKAPHNAHTNSIQELRMIKCRRVALEESGTPFAPRTIHIVDKLCAFKPEDRPASYDDTVDELRLAEGLTDHTIMPRMSMRRRIAFGTAAAMVLAYLIGWLFQTQFAKPPTSTYTSAPVVQNKLAGDSTTVSAGQRSVADRFLEARKTLLAGDFKQAEHKFESILKDGAKQPTLNKTRYNAALCAMIAGGKKRALELFAQITADPGTPGEAATAFYQKLGRHMSASLALGEKPAQLDFDELTEEVMGYLAYGLAQWHFGDPVAGNEALTRFVKSRQLDRGLDWIDEYRSLVAPYAEDAAKLPLLRKRDTKLPTAEAEAILKESEQARRELKTDGRMSQEFDQRIARLKREITDAHKAAQSASLKEEAKHRQSELQQLGQIRTLLPNLVRGYDFSPAVGVLKDMQFESPEVKASIESKLYLYSGGMDFLKQLFTDVAAKSWNGHLVRRDGPPLDGKVTGVTMSEVTLSMSRGALTLPLEQIEPTTLIEMAQAYCTPVSDSTEYYHRQELIAIFARLEGLPEVSSNVATQLMDENREFRTRWLRVLQSGS